MDHDQDLLNLTVIDQHIQDVLTEINTIATMIKTNKKIPIEDLHQKIKKALQKIKQLLNQNPALEQEASLSQAQSAMRDLGLEENPLIDDLGGMPLEVISNEWSEFDAEVTNVLDKTELENLIKKKLKNREELANRLKNSPALKNQPQNAPKAAPAITPKFEQTIQYIYKEMPPPPAPTPPAPKATRLLRPRPF